MQKMPRYPFQAKSSTFCRKNIRAFLFYRRICKKVPWGNSPGDFYDLTISLYPICNLSHEEQPV